MKKILVTGANGMLGKTIQKGFSLNKDSTEFVQNNEDLIKIFTKKGEKL